MLSRPFLPPVKILTSLPLATQATGMGLLASLAMLALKPPHRPRSAVMTTKQMNLIRPRARFSSLGAVSDPPTEAANRDITALKRSV